MLCRDVMKGDVRFIAAQTTVAQAAAIDATATLRSVTVRVARA